MDIPFVDLRAQYARLRGEIDTRIRAVLDHGRYILGPEVAELEQKLAAFAGCRHGIGVSSGTDALLVALLAEGIGGGDALFVPAFTFPATPAAILLAGATPVFVDVSVDSFHIDAAALQRSIRIVADRGALRPRAVIAVDLFGLTADYDALTPIAAEHELFLLADAAQSFGAAWNGRRVGSLAPVTALSFYPSKPLGCYGDGGAILTDDDARAALIHSIREHGRGIERYAIERIGINGRLDTLQAAVLLAKLGVFEEELAQRQRLAGIYDEHLKDIVSIPPRPPAARPAWAQYSILSDHRDAIAAALRKEGLPCAIHYPAPLHLQPAFARFGGGAGTLPAAEALSRRILSLPMHAYMAEDTALRICDAVRRGARSTSQRR